jgi:hypothetical protein
LWIAALANIASWKDVSMRHPYTNCVRRVQKSLVSLLSLLKEVPAMVDVREMSVYLLYNVRPCEPFASKSLTSGSKLSYQGTNIASRCDQL